MELDDIRKLIELMEEKGLAELELKNRVGEVRLVRSIARASGAAEAFVPASVVPAVPQPAEAQPASAAWAPPAATSAPESPPDLGLTIPSPMVGTFYRSPNPDAEVYVEVGTIVEKGDVVCIIEAMKMMNEIQAEVRGRITRILVDNSQPVEYEQPLFVIEPL
jgi:acetyl-CoA carboxylase biotin carboxyl carrier protein